MADAATPADTSDLKTFDVPDPIRPRGSCALGFVKMLVALGLAVGFVVAKKTDMMLGVYQDDRASDYQRELAYRHLRGQGDAVLERILAIQEPSLRGAFHPLLAGTGDAAHAEAIAAWIREWEIDYVYYAGASLGTSMERLEDGLPSLVKLDRPAAAALAIGLYRDPPKGRYGADESDSVREAVPTLVEQHLKPEELAPHVVPIEEPALRGRFYRALATTKDPAHIDAILAYVASKSPRGAMSDEGTIETSHEWAPVAETLRQFPNATPRLEQALQSDVRSVVNLAAEALRDTDLPFLVGYTQRLLTRYDEGVPELQRAAYALKGAAQAAEVELSQGDARKILDEYTRLGYLLSEILRALTAVGENEDVDFCFIRGLSTWNEPVAKFCAQQLKVRLSPEKLIDTLFRYIAAKDEFMVREVEVYEGLMREQGAAGAGRIGKNLERLLGEAEGSPEGVFWIYKVMGLRVLKDIGTPAEIALIEKYGRDTKSYVETSTASDGTEEQVRIHYRDQAAAAIAAIRSRAPERD